MAFACRNDKFESEEKPEMNPGLGDISAFLSNRKVERFIAHKGQEHIAHAFPDPHPRPRPLRPKTGHRAGYQGQAQRRTNAEGDRPFGTAAERRQVFLDLPQLSLNDAGAGDEGAPRGGECDAARGPRQELGLELPLELREALAHGGLRYADTPRRRPQAAGFAYRDQVPDLNSGALAITYCYRA